MRENLVIIIENNFPPVIFEGNVFSPSAKIGFDGKEINDINAHFLGKSWRLVDWSFLQRLHPEIWHIISTLSLYGYEFLFPSFLFGCVCDEGLLYDNFIESHLNINNISNRGQIDFYSKLNDGQATCVAEVLAYVALSKKNALATDALNSYWAAFL